MKKLLQLLTLSTVLSTTTLSTIVCNNNTLQKQYEVVGGTIFYDFEVDHIYRFIYHM